MKQLIKTVIITTSILLNSACAQQQSKPKTTEKTTVMDTFKTNTHKYLNDTRPGYYIQINNQNCYYELEINNLSSAEYFDSYPGYSVRVPINYEILKSGDQKLSLSVFPYQGDTLSSKAHLQMRLLMYPDMTDVENDYGGSTTLWEWKMPDIGEQKLPFIKFDTIFKAEVPYKITTLDTDATDLSKMDKKELLKEVVNEFTTIRKNVINKTQNKNELKKMLNRGLIQIYENEKFGDEMIEDMINLGDGKEPQPLENFEMRLYYNNRVVTLIKQDDKESAIWFKNPETGDTSWQPVYLYKDVSTGKWKRW